MTKLGERGALRKTVCISAKSQPEYVLNKFRKDHWLQPSKGEYHEIFDLFIRSLGDDKQENMTHIKTVVAWKYLHPEDYSLPCLVIFGQGGAGKTSFVTTLLSTIFGRHQTIAIQQESMKNFNGIVAGKIAVSLEESVWDKADKNHLKTIIGQRTVMVNEKYGRQYDADNISLYVCGGNGALGAAKLGRDQSDRRFSILKVTRSIIDHVMEVKSLNRDDAIDWWE
jgi:predicted P-loop ATPase